MIITASQHQIPIVPCLHHQPFQPRGRFRQYRNEDAGGVGQVEHRQLAIRGEHGQAAVTGFHRPGIAGEFPQRDRSVADRVDQIEPYLPGREAAGQFVELVHRHDPPTGSGQPLPSVREVVGLEKAAVI